jgi:hypothetical protein
MPPAAPGLQVAGDAGKIREILPTVWPGCPPPDNSRKMKRQLLGNEHPLLAAPMES